uniref:Uncharacterized protein LOC116957965 n=1 Tax=Petromyzon marinus TaxID=7757 RepID=A0AAJ7UHD5_PETMA|nr:uncharacterized protein LOC116957965 [Petromyzon marinus]
MSGKAAKKRNVPVDSGGDSDNNDLQPGQMAGITPDGDSGSPPEVAAQPERLEDSDDEDDQLEGPPRRLHESLRGMKARISQEFERKTQQLNKEEREALEHVDEEGRSVLSRIQANITLYEIRTRSLGQEINELLTALAVKDPLTFLQDPKYEELRNSVSQETQDDPAPTFSQQELTKVISAGGVEMRLLALLSSAARSFRTAFPVRPQLRRNVALANLAEQLRVGDGMAAAVVCDICGDGQTPAVKTCLRCEMSFCFSHYKPHVENPRLKDHTVVDPTTSLDERRCPEHSEELKFYCTVDSSLVCSTCTIAGEHKGHDVTTLKNEHETRKTHIGEEMRTVEKKRKKAKKSMKRMEAAHKEAQESVAGIRGRITGKFARLRKALDEDEREALQRVAVKERELLSQIEEDIARQKREISELQAAGARLRALLHERDSLAFLQVGSASGETPFGRPEQQSGQWQRDSWCMGRDVTHDLSLSSTGAPGGDAKVQILNASRLNTQHGAVCETLDMCVRHMGFL